MTRDEIQNELINILVEMFELDRADVVPSANLYKDLDIDSIDAVDLVVRLKDFTGKKINIERYKQIQTVADIVDAVEEMMA